MIERKRKNQHVLRRLRLRAVLPDAQFSLFFSQILTIIRDDLKRLYIVFFCTCIYL